MLSGLGFSFLGCFRLLIQSPYSLLVWPDFLFLFNNSDLVVYKFLGIYFFQIIQHVGAWLFIVVSHDPFCVCSINCNVYSFIALLFHFILVFFHFSYVNVMFVSFVCQFCLSFQMPALSFIKLSYCFSSLYFTYFFSNVIISFLLLSLGLVCSFYLVHWSV